MHKVIRIIVYANSKEEALERAKETLEQYLVGEEKPFDYYTTFDIPKKSAPMSGRARWGNLPPAVKLMSKKGIELLDKAWEWTVEEFKEHLEELIKIGKECNWDFRKLMEDNWFKYHALCLGEEKGWGVWVFDEDGNGIKSLEHLKNVIEKWKSVLGEENPYKDKEVWIVPVDVHY